LHRNLTPGVRYKFLKRVLGTSLLLATTAVALAQDANLSTYQGPGISSRGVGDVGTRSGEQVSLRYYAGVLGIMDSNLQPFVTDTKGNLIRIRNLYGVEVSGGVYGVHSWKHSQLGLDYVGSYHRYTNLDVYNGSDQSLNLGYTIQSSRHWTFDLRESAGTLSVGTGLVSTGASNDPVSSFAPTALIFDTRTNYLQSSAFATYTQSARLSYTVGGSAFLQDRKTQGLSNSWGYDFSGTMQRRMTKTATVGASYTYSHFELPGLVSRSDSHSFHGTYATAFTRRLTLWVEAGATVTEVESPFTLKLDPALAALFGQPTIQGTTFFRTVYPSGRASLTRYFKNASFGLNYFRGANSGNGAYGAGRLDNAGLTVSYTGVRRLNAGLEGGYYSLSSIGQSTGKYSTYSAAAGFTYLLGRAIHLSARYDVHDQQIDISGFRRTSSRVAFGLLFSPGNRPLALW
jgi:hypothetical protein